MLDKLMISYLIGWIILIELVYLLICKYSDEEDVKYDWFSYKVLGLLGGTFAICGIALIIYLLKKYLIETAITIVVLGLISCFIIMNRELGLWISKKPKPKRKTARRVSKK